MDFGTTARGHLYQGVPETSLPSDHFTHYCGKRLCVPCKGLSQGTLTLWSIFILINLANHCLKGLLVRFLVWGPLILGDQQGIHLAHSTLGSAVLKPLF